MRPGFAHAAIAAVLTLLVAGLASIAAFCGVPIGPAAVGVAFAIAFYVGRERRQSEEWWGSNRIPPWRWGPRALRDAGWPALASLAVAAALFRIWG